MSENIIKEKTPPQQIKPIPHSPRELETEALNTTILHIELCPPLDIYSLAQKLEIIDGELVEYRKKNANAAIHINISLR